jgi:hypothetical protein
MLAGRGGVRTLKPEVGWDGDLVLFFNSLIETEARRGGGTWLRPHRPAAMDSRLKIKVGLDSGCLAV